MKQIHILYLFLFSFCFSMSKTYGQAQIKLLDTLNCNNYTYCVDVGLTASTKSFDLGTSSIQLQYDNEVLSFKNYTPEDFDATSLCSNVWAPQKTDLVIEEGLFGLTIRLLDPNSTCLTVDGLSTRIMGRICFDVIKQGSSPKIYFKALNTNLNIGNPDNGVMTVAISLMDSLDTAGVLACDCPGAGVACDDNNVYTTNDQYDEYCICQGTLEDADGDGIVDGVDNCNDNFFEAEDGTVIGATLKNNYPQYNGSGFVDYAHTSGDTIALNISVDSTGVYDLKFRYTNGSTSTRYLKFNLDNTTILDSLAFPQTTNWGDWQEILLSQNILVGAHTIYLLTDGSHGPNLDRISISICGNCNQAGQYCDDGDPCTVLDVWDTNCDCKGVYMDSDNDNICDANDICPQGDDNIDSDGDGIPDACDPCDNTLIGTACDDGDPCTVNDVYDSNCNCVGTVSGTDSDGDGVCDAFDACPGFDDNLDIDSDGIPDGCDPCNDLEIGFPCDDGNPCTILDIVNPGCGCSGIPVYLDLSATIDSITCFEGTGNITLNPSHMVGEVYYRWNTGAFSKDMTNLGTGTYMVTATDWRGCSTADTFYLSQPNILNLDFATTPSSGSDGAIDLTVSGGAPNYTYFWKDSTTTEDLNALIPDRYHVTVTDRLSCEKSGAANVFPDTLCAEASFQYEYGNIYNARTINTEYPAAMDGYVRLENNAISHVSFNHHFSDYGKYDFTIVSSHSWKKYPVDIYLDSILIIDSLILPKTGSYSTFEAVTFSIDSIAPGEHIITTAVHGNQVWGSYLDYMAVCLNQSINCSNLIGTACDDGNPCTINDAIDTNCDCIGTIVDSDFDGVCDGEDLCPGYDDNDDSDNDGIPDGCDNCYPNRFEAEDAWSTGTTKRTYGNTYSGTGYEDFRHNTGDTIRFIFEVPMAGEYTLNLGYSTNSSNRYLDVHVNNVQIKDSLYFPKTGSSYNNWEELSLTTQLNYGENRIELISDENPGPNIDYIQYCLPGLMPAPQIAKGNDGFEEGFEHWTRLHLWNNSNTHIVIDTTDVLCGVQSANYYGNGKEEQLYADLEYLLLDSIYTLHFYAARDSAIGYIGLPDNIYNGQQFLVDATSGNGGFVHHQVTFTASASRMRVWFDFYPNTPIILDAFSFDDDHCSVALQPKAFLQGPFDPTDSLMHDQLRSNGLIPLTEPYTLLDSFIHKGQGGGEQIDTTILETTGDDAIVDWVFLELRDKSDSTIVLATRSALLQRDGDIVDLDGYSPVKFKVRFDDQYFVALRHRNHLGIMTDSAISLSLTPKVLDLSTGVTATWGLNGQKDTGVGILALHSGNANQDAQINAVDRNLYWRLQNGQTYQYLLRTADFNLDGAVNAVDINLHWRLNNSILEQLPR